METLLFILFFISFVYLIVGLVRPHLVLRFLKGDKTRRKVILVFGTLSVLFLVLCGLFITPQPEKQKSDKEKSKTEVYAVSIGEVAKNSTIFIKSIVMNLK